MWNIHARTRKRRPFGQVRVGVMFPTHHHQQHQLGNQHDPHYHSNPVLKWHWKQNDWCCKHTSNRCIWLWRGSGRRRGRGARLKGLQAVNASTQSLSSASSTWLTTSRWHERCRKAHVDFRYHQLLKHLSPFPLENILPYRACLTWLFSPAVILSVRES